jgi:hypothetical protein
MTTDADGDDPEWESYDSDGCNTCMGAGTVIVCIDDMCRGAGECIHGDGEIVCPDCGGV